MAQRGLPIAAWRRKRMLRRPRARSIWSLSIATGRAADSALNPHRRRHGRRAEARFLGLSARARRWPVSSYFRYRHIAIALARRFIERQGFPSTNLPPVPVVIWNG